MSVPQKQAGNRGRSLQRKSLLPTGGGTDHLAAASETGARNDLGGGFEILAALALHLGWVEHTAEVIGQVVARFRRSVFYRQERVSKDRKGRQAGRFTVAYNRRLDVRQQRFASVEEKRQDKNYSRMGLFQASPFILERKCLGILAFPLITLNGGTRSANVPLGNTLEHFCGFNYQHHTLDKFLRELKYLGLAEDLLRNQVGFWQQHWRKLGESSELLKISGQTV